MHRRKWCSYSGREQHQRHLPQSRIRRIQPLRGGTPAFPDQRINPQVAQTLAMEVLGSSQWMEPLEPELEAAMLNRYAGRAGSGGGLVGRRCRMEDARRGGGSAA